jgi:hypothetical protein
LVSRALVRPTAFPLFLAFFSLFFYHLFFFFFFF